MKTPTTTAVPTAAPLSRKVKTLIDGIRQPFASFTGDLAGLTTKRSELAPKFMKAYNAWAAETSGNFPAFCRLLDPTIGPNRADYRTHRAFQAADYLRRLVARMNRPERPAGVQRPATPMDAVARLLKTITPLIGADEIGKLRDAIRKELHWSERQVSRLSAKADTAEPLAQLRVPKGSPVAMPPLRILPAVHRPPVSAAHEPQVAAG